MKKIVIDECISQFRVRYAVQADTELDAEDYVVMYEHDTDKLQEFSQQHLGTTIFGSREITSDEYFKLFDEDNKYISDWTKEQKTGLINIDTYSEGGLRNV